MQISVHGAGCDRIRTGERRKLSRRGEGMLYFGADDTLVLGLFRIPSHKCVNEIEQGTAACTGIVKGFEPTFRDRKLCAQHERPDAHVKDREEILKKRGRIGICRAHTVKKERREMSKDTLVHGVEIPLRGRKVQRKVVNAPALTVMTVEKLSLHRVGVLDDAARKET